ncbi:MULTISPECIES: HAD family hydrolase [unclassified Crossiella]|uniref:HAD family hydrolase n=1 Tax=unclassified Crossiella TaxID=2620835 RepID=UPI001FFEF51C|nr:MULTISPECIES: HAD family hydrolase [unclassified Crossiella]MCK2245422.1 HAD family hydrolase [Crossiella sp. S99.2]MCK2259074.1 HAD family hydrolase [Crossiella sp. S99.1]
MKRRDTVILDLDGTLIDERSNVDGAFLAAGLLVQQETGIDAHRFASIARLAAQRLWWKPRWLDPLGDEFGLSAWDGLSAQYTGAVQALDRLRAWLPAYRQAAWTLTLDRCGLQGSSLSTMVSEAFVEHRRDHVECLPGAMELVSTLAKDRALVVLTNGPGDGQRGKLAVSGVSDHVQDIVVSTELGVAKPHKAAMDTALARVGGRTATAIMIGDSYDRDIQGALASDVPALWIAGDHTHDRSRHRLVTTVKTTADVLSALRDLEGSAGP